MKFKVCGMTSKQQVLQLEAIGVDYAGFIFYEKSRRYVYDKMTCEEIKSINGNILKVGVFVNASQGEILKTVSECGIEIIQLHGDETPKFCESISDHVKVIKAFRLGNEYNFENRIRPYEDFCDMYLFDTAGSGYGGSGAKFDWEILRDLRVNKPFFLSGGIHPEDVSAIKDFQLQTVANDLYAVDINSGFELEPGVKDIGKIEKFINRLHTDKQVTK